jgi:hypothetical protein
MDLKKVLSLLALVILGGTLTAGFFVFDRYRQNPEQIVPYPYTFKEQAPGVKLDAPILITGDRMGVYFAKFQSELAATISQNLDRPIKIQSMAKNGFGIHRTLHELKALSQWPQILVYQGASEEFQEIKFEPSEIQKIKTNFARYNDDRIETALILYPWLSKIVYEPIKRVKLEAQPLLLDEITEADYLKRIETELLLFRQQLIELVNLSKDRNSLLILTTTPINIDISPKRICEFTSTIELEKAIADLRDLLKKNDPKTAYTQSSKLIKQYTGNALLFFIHGQISRRLGYLDEAKKSLLEASAYDCNPWRATEVFNSIIRKVAKDHQVIMFDFAKLVGNEWATNTTFFDEIYPQNLYYDQGMKQLGLVLKEILKL